MYFFRSALQRVELTTSTILCVMSVFCLIIGLVSVKTFAPYENTSDNILSWHNIPCQTVNRTVWPTTLDLHEESQFIQNLSSNRKPQIIQAPKKFDKHNIPSDWSPEWISKNIQLFSQVRKQRGNNLFLYYNPNRGLENVILHTNNSKPVPLGPQFTEHNFPPNEFFAMLHEENQKPKNERNYLYFSGHASHFTPKFFNTIDKATDIFIIQDEASKEIAKNLSSGDGSGEIEGELIHEKIVNVWVGGEGVTASAHYDSSENFFMQMHGTKRFVLFPPEESWKLYLHSFFHPYYRRSQVNIEKYPLENIRGFIADLIPGDILYLPPYWFHHVISTSNISISMNIWSNSREYWENEAIFNAPIPLESEWSLAKNTCMMLFYLEYLIDGLKIQYDSSNFLYNGEFACENSNLSLVEKHKEIFMYFNLLFRSRFEQSLGVISREHPVLEKYRNEISSCFINEEFHRDVPDLKERLERGFSHVSEHYFSMHSQGIRDINFANYVESIIAMVVGLEELHPFIQAMQTFSSCLNLPE